MEDERRLVESAVERERVRVTRRRRGVPLAAHWSETALVRILGPAQEFMHNTAAGGIVLVLASIAALVLANSPLSEQYDAILHAPLGFRAGPFVLEYSVQHWINDGLMAVFFFGVGLEIKREFLVGELAERTKAMPC